MTRVKLKWFNGEEDKERAILPTLMFNSDRVDHISVWCIAIGWWKWGVGIVVTTIEGV